MQNVKIGFECPGGFNNRKSRLLATPLFSTLALLAFIISLAWLNSKQISTRTNKKTASAKLDLAAQHKLKGAARKAASVEWFMAQRAYGLGYIPQDAEIRAVEDMRQRMIPELAAKGIRLQKSAAGQLNWEYHGPGNIGGRLRGLVVHPDDPNILYAGSVSGGVWKSTDAGASWFPTMNDLITLNISALKMKPGDPNTLYAGTGEAFFNGDALPGRGVFKTTDGGQAWTRLHVSNGLNLPFITELAVSPANPNVVYAAGRQAVPQSGRRLETVPDPGVSAIFKSTDSGETWQDITSGKIEHDPSFIRDNYAADVVASPIDANLVYATFGLFYWGGIWKSTDGGQTWSRLINGLPDPNLPNLGYSRIELAMAPSNPNILYASFTYEWKAGDTADLINRGMLGIWKTTDAGQSWTQVNTPLTINQRNRNDGYTTALGYQGNYANAIIVHPTDPNIVFVGGLDIYKSTDGGNSWTQVSMWLEPGDSQNPENLPYVHADHHVFAFDLSTKPPMFYSGSDGGIARSRDLGKSWEILNKDLGVTQFYYFAVHPTNPNIMLGGTQDNGTPMLINSSINNWFEPVPGGDGGPSYFDFKNPSTVYSSEQYMNMYRLDFDYSASRLVSRKQIGFTDGSNGITPDDVNAIFFFAPYEMSPNNPNVLVLGTRRVLKTTNRGDSWSPISVEVDTPIVAVAIGEGNDNVIWAATQDAKIFKTENNGMSWTEMQRRNLPNRFLTDIEFDPSNRNTVYLTYSGYGSSHVFKSTDAGASWTNLTNNLPDAPANTIEVHPQLPNLLFLGTDIGVFLSEDGGQTWQPATSGFPTVQVVVIVLNTKVNRVYAATHGRGVYSATLPGGGTAALNIDVAEVSLQLPPGQTRSTAFTISNSGNANLSYSITATGPSGLANGPSNTASLSGLVNATQPELPGIDLATTFAEKGVTPVLRANAAATPASPSPHHVVAGTDVLILDDGDNSSDDFVGFGPDSTSNFYWANMFSLPGFGFRLEAFDFYMRSESASSNPVYVAIHDAKGQKLLNGVLNLATSSDGRWYTIKITNPLQFNAGSSFSIVLGASKIIDYPAGTDVDASVPNSSFYYDPDQKKYVNLNTVPGFKNGAFLIRAAGTKTSGHNQPPVARALASTLQAKVNEPITFDASQSFDPDGQITEYLWNFGDNNMSAQKVSAHAYSQAGMYTITLTVTDNQGATGQASGQIKIDAETTTRLSVNPASGTIAPGGSQTITVTFDAQGLAEGNYQAQLNITSNGGDRTVPVRIHVSNTTGVKDNVAGLPRAFRLEQNYPNPFWSEAASSAFSGGNPETNIHYELPNDGNITLAIFDLNGRRVALLESGLKTAGRHFVRWNGHDSAGNHVTSGVYFYRLQATSPDGTATILTKKMTVMK